VTQAVGYPDSTVAAVSVAVNGLVESATSKTGLTTAYEYDGLGRRTGVTDPRAGASITHYNSLGQVDCTEDAAGNQTAYAYSADTGRQVTVADALGNTTFSAYNSRGEVTHTWGTATYPVAYTHDEFGRMTGMHTFRNGTGWGAPPWPADPGDGDATTWVYDEATGLLAEKVYADGKGTSYTYDAAGRLATRTWARTDDGQPLVTTYVYDQATGELLEVDYSDNTGDIVYTYTRAAQIETVADAAGIRTFTYTPTLQAEFEAIEFDLPGQPPQDHDCVITRSYDDLGRDTGFIFETLRRHNAEHGVQYGYDDFGRFASVTTGRGGRDERQFSFSYLQDADLLATTTYPNGLTATRTYEPQRNLLTVVENSVDGSTVSRYGYENDAAGRRTAMLMSGSAFEQSSFFAYGYNTRSELTEARRYLGTDAGNLGNPVTGQQFVYQFDNIGNRETYSANGDTTQYTTNSLNQYTQTEDPNETFLYDDDGNMIQDGTFTYSWNAENRLTDVSNLETWVQFTYDYRGRRVLKTVHEWKGNQKNGRWQQKSSTIWVYDGWNPFAVFDGPSGNSRVRTYTWGLDLSQSLQGAGGVGGLLACQSHGGGQPQDAYYYYDGNGNVGQLADADDGTVAAHYEYKPFGAELVAEGELAVSNQYRFSTKWSDDQAELYDYGYRNYDPALGRWITRDPLLEAGFARLLRLAGTRLVPKRSTPSRHSASNALSGIPRRWGEDSETDRERTSEEPRLLAYSFVRNAPIGSYDPFGLATATDSCPGGLKAYASDCAIEGKCTVTAGGKTHTGQSCQAIAFAGDANLEGCPLRCRCQIWYCMGCFYFEGTGVYRRRIRSYYLTRNLSGWIDDSAEWPDGFPAGPSYDSLDDCLEGCDEFPWPFD